MTVHVRWPGQTSGAFGLALIFLVLFASRQKEQKRFFQTFKKGKYSGYLHNELGSAHGRFELIGIFVIGHN